MSGSLPQQKAQIYPYFGVSLLRPERKVRLFRSHWLWDPSPENTLKVPECYHDLYCPSALKSGMVSVKLLLMDLGKYLLSRNSSLVSVTVTVSILPAKYSNDRLNRFVWARWLPSGSLDTIGYAGYYAVNYTDQLRIISLNTQYCDHLNFWLYVNNTDPGNMLL